MLVDKNRGGDVTKARYGKFRISQTIIRRATETDNLTMRDALRWVFSRTIVFEATAHYLKDCIEYHAASELFDVYQEGDEVPLYVFYFKIDEGLDSMKCECAGVGGIPRHTDFTYLDMM